MRSRPRGRLVPRVGAPEGDPPLGAASRRTAREPSLSGRPHFSLAWAPHPAGQPAPLPPGPSRWLYSGPSSTGGGADGLRGRRAFVGGLRPALGVAEGPGDREARAVVLVSIVVSIPACHAGDRGSIPRRGGESFLLVRSGPGRAGPATPAPSSSGDRPLGTTTPEPVVGSPAACCCQTSAGVPPAPWPLAFLGAGASKRAILAQRLSEWANRTAPQRCTAGRLNQAGRGGLRGPRNWA